MGGSAVLRTGADNIWDLAGARALYDFEHVVAVEGEVLADVFRLRHQRYAVDLGLRYPSVSPHADQLEDAIDRVSLNLAYVGSDGRIATATRNTWLADIPRDDYFGRWHASVPAEEAPTTIFCSRVVAQGRFDLRAMTCLWRATYAAGLAAGGTYSCSSTRAELVPLFEKFG